MAAAIRSMLGKSGNRISSVANMVAMGDSEIRTLNINHNLNLGYSSRHPLESFSLVNRPSNIRSPKKLEPKHPEIPRKLYGASLFSRSSRYCTRVVLYSHLALEEFNKQKNGQLQFVKVVKAFNQWSGGWKSHLLTLEAIDADNVIKTYQAIVVEHFPSNPPPQLVLFGLVADDGNGSLLKLIDNRPACMGGPVDNRYVERESIKLQKKTKYSLEDGILSSLRSSTCLGLTDFYVNKNCIFIRLHQIN